jgi:hypothetical protein
MMQHDRLSFSGVSMIQISNRNRTLGAHHESTTRSDRPARAGTAHTSPTPGTAVFVTADADSDGMPDRWEIDHFGSVDAVNGGTTDDWDQDGLFFNYWKKIVRNASRATSDFESGHVVCWQT